jgi:hypothetical protein
VRLACVKHAASVRSEPGSNSQVHHVLPHGRTRRTNPASYQKGSRFLMWKSETILTSVTVTHQKRYITATPTNIKANPKTGFIAKPHQRSKPNAQTVSYPLRHETQGRRQRIPSIEYAIVKEPADRQTPSAPHHTVLPASSALLEHPTGADR